MATNEFIESTAELTDIVTKYCLTFGDTDKEESATNRGIRKATDHFIDAQAEFYDTCLSCIKSLFPSEDKNSDKEIRLFRDITKQYSKHIMPQANHIKHRQSKVNNIVQSCGDVVIPGYFIESAIPSIGIGPDPIIHKKHDNQFTAFSYTREIRLAIIGLIHTSQALSSRVEKIRDLKPSTDYTDNTKLKELVRKVSNLPPYVYDDETSKELPLISIDANMLSVKYGVNQRKEQKSLIWSTVSFMFEVDPVTRTMVLPYFQGR